MPTLSRFLHIYHCSTQVGNRGGGVGERVGEGRGWGRGGEGRGWGRGGGERVGDYMLRVCNNLHFTYVVKNTNNSVIKVNKNGLNIEFCIFQKLYLRAVQRESKIC